MAPGERRFALLFALGVALLAVLPNLYAVLDPPVGSQYLGVQYNTDDHMVYAAWARQAMEGSLLFDNRFTTDPQPGLTLHLYYLVIGWFATLTGIPLALAISRFVFSGLFCWLLYGFIRRVMPDGYGAKLSMVLTVFGAGVGFLVWHMYGQEIVRPAPDLLKSMMLGRLPTDVWQPEGFVFPSMLTSSLFMVSLCLILLVFGAFLDASEGWKPALVGTSALGVLMNVHSYDVLLIALVMVAFLGTTIVRRQIHWPWLLRAIVIALGAMPAAVWFLYVLRNDPVFQARAATETFSANYRQVFFGYLGLLLLGLYGVFSATAAGGLRAKLGVASLGLLLLVGFFLSQDHTQGYWMGPVAWVVVFALVVGVVAMASTDQPGFNLVLAWAAVGIVALYFPALFQRKLAMGLSVPWGILAGLGAAGLLSRFDRGTRNLVAVLLGAVLCGSSVQWAFRQRNFINANVSNTTMHPVYVGPDATRILAYLNKNKKGRTVVLAMPGVATPADKDAFQAPLVPDLNPIVSGLAGAYTYAGHWSETPDYMARRARLTKFFLRDTSDEERRALVEEVGADYVLAPAPEAFADIPLPLADLRHLGEVVVDGSQFRLIRL